MTPESVRKELALEHCRRVNEGDLDGLLKIYSPNVVFEDPVGSGRRVGHQALRTHAGGAISGGVYEEADEPVATQDGRHAAVFVTATVHYLPSGPVLARHGLITPAADPATARLRFRYLMVIGVGEDALIDSMRAYWGRTDITVLPAG